VGAVALQNVGAVLLLVGFFFLVLWGYSTHRLGPGVLVAAGVVAGLGVIWRGDRLQRTVRGLGAALIGAGVVWLSLYLGHTTLHALPPAWALPLLFGASALTAALGLRYQVQGIAALGVLGAFLPHALQFLVPMAATPTTPWMLLAYLVPVNLLVLALAMRSGWSALALTSVLFTAVTWSASVSTDRWSWPLQIALSLLFTTLGVAPLPRLVRVEGRVRAVDLALIAVAPVAMLAASWPMFALARSEHVALLLGSLAALHFVLAWAVDRVRPERDLWRPLTAASTLFLVVATERAVVASFLMLLWLARVGDHVARVMLDAPGAEVAAWQAADADLRDRVLSLGAILATVGWLGQAVAAFLLGWRRQSAFLRWMALALLALTLLKFVLVDLAHADPFWRFLTALVAGAAMLGLSFVYQRLGVVKKA